MSESLIGFCASPKAAVLPDGEVFWTRDDDPTGGIAQTACVGATPVGTKKRAVGASPDGVWLVAADAAGYVYRSQGEQVRWERVGRGTCNGIGNDGVWFGRNLIPRTSQPIGYAGAVMGVCAGEVVSLDNGTLYIGGVAIAPTASVSKVGESRVYGAIPLDGGDGWRAATWDVGGDVTLHDGLAAHGEIDAGLVTSRISADRVWETVVGGDLVARGVAGSPQVSGGRVFVMRGGVGAMELREIV